MHALKRLDSNKLHGVKVQQLAADLGISRRHFNRLVQEQIGFTAKHFLQIYRFNNTLSHIHKSEKISLAQMAYQFGYSDQAHFSHEFKTMTDLSPKAYLKQIRKEDFVELDGEFLLTGMSGFRNTY